MTSSTYSHERVGLDATYRKYYFKKKIYRQYSSAHRFVPIEFLLRMKTDDVGKPFDHDMKDDDE